MENELSNMDIALFALYKKGGVSQKVHTEEVAWEAYQLAKERFSWRLLKFRQMGFPDKTPVRFALEQAKKKENGKLVSGRSGGDAGGELEGWCFTSQGAIWIKENETRISENLKQKVPNVPKREAERFIKKIKIDAFFRYFQEKGNLDEASQYMFTDMLVCAPDASKKIIRQKFEQLYSNAELVNDLEILDFLGACKGKFNDLVT
ncbi:MAG: hypothetical protein ACOC6R_00245 [Chloroflexota bacterium]